MTKKTYSEKLKDPRWQKLRLKILEIYKFTCGSFGDAKTELHVHHKRYIKGRQPWEYELGDLTVVCKHCHSFLEFAKKGNLNLLSIIKRETVGGIFFMFSSFKDIKDNNEKIYMAIYNEHGLVPLIILESDDIWMMYQLVIEIPKQFSDAK